MQSEPGASVTSRKIQILGASEGDRNESEGKWSELEEVRLEGLGIPPLPHLPESQGKDEDPSRVKDFIGGRQFCCLCSVNLAG